ncbi:MAG: hypothetical protein EBR67_05880 [Proteobacteria bacterium]|nr:hypothetical protein [Pseudomonadota bacterium]
MVTSQRVFQNSGANDLLQQGAEIRAQQQGAGASIVDSDVGKAALAKNEELKGIKAKFEGTLQTLKAQKKEAEGQQNIQKGGAQEKIGETMITTGQALLAAGAATFGTTAWVGLGMIATGTGVALTGGQQQQQGQQQVEEAPAYQSKANDLSGQSETYFSTAQQLRSEAEAEQQDAAPDDPNGAKTQGQQKGYFIGDSLADASSSEDESTIAKLRDGADKISGIGGTSNDEELVADASSEVAIMGGADTDGGTPSLETKKEAVA